MGAWADQLIPAIADEWEVWMMRAVTNLWRLTVGKKVIMAVCGLGLLGFVLGHLFGNLKIFMGREHFNEYASWLRVMGEPLLPAGMALWAFRIGLLVIVVLHVLIAWQLYVLSQTARPIQYRVNDTKLVDSRVSLFMRITGVALAVFILFHLMDLTWGWTDPVNFVHGDAYSNVVRSFSRGWVFWLYVIAMGTLCLHLYHGIYSALQTLGLNSPRYNALRRPVAAIVAIGLLLGNCLMPICVQLGLLSL